MFTRAGICSLQTTLQSRQLPLLQQLRAMIRRSKQMEVIPLAQFRRNHLLHLSLTKMPKASRPQLVPIQQTTQIIRQRHQLNQIKTKLPIKHPIFLLQRPMSPLIQVHQHSRIPPLQTTNPAPLYLQLRAIQTHPQHPHHRKIVNNQIFVQLILPIQAVLSKITIITQSLMHLKNQTKTQFWPLKSCFPSHFSYQLYPSCVLSTKE